MNRRNFLKSMIAISAAPAVVKAENLMKIWVPPHVEQSSKGVIRVIYGTTESALYQGDLLTICPKTGLYRKPKPGEVICGIYHSKEVGVIRVVGEQE